MTDAELDRLADLIAQALLGHTPSGPRDRSAWLPTPVRPEPPARGSEPPVWSAAAQPLGDVAPVRDPGEAPPHRGSIADATNATRAAAAGRGAPVASSGAKGRVAHQARPRSANAPSIDVRIGVSNRHVHLSEAHAHALFGTALTSLRPLTQPGQFAANQTVAVEGPKGRIETIRVVGPARGETQLELAASDAHLLGVTPPLAASGSLGGSGGGVTLVGPAGRVKLDRGVIIAARHLHLAPNDASRWGLRDGDRLAVRCGSGARATTFHDVLVRSGSGHATELHLDVDEARGAGVTTGDSATIIAWRGAASQKRRLLTERDVLDLARNGTPIPAGAILTPSARDRARALKLLAD
jgi:putative phosphotransacetylase